MKIIGKKHNGEINCIRYYETTIKIEIDSKEKEFEITYESDWNGGELKIYDENGENSDEKIKQFIVDNWDEIGLEEEDSDDNWVTINN